MKYPARLALLPICAVSVGVWFQSFTLIEALATALVASSALLPSVAIGMYNKRQPAPQPIVASVYLTLAVGLMALCAIVVSPVIEASEISAIAAPDLLLSAAPILLVLPIYHPFYGLIFTEFGKILFVLVALTALTALPSELARVSPLWGFEWGFASLHKVWLVTVTIPIAIVVHRLTMPRQGQVIRANLPRRKLH